MSLPAGHVDGERTLYDRAWVRRARAGFDPTGRGRRSRTTAPVAVFGAGKASADCLPDDKLLAAPSSDSLVSWPAGRSGRSTERVGGNLPELLNPHV